LSDRSLGLSDLRAGDEDVRILRQCALHGLGEIQRVRRGCAGRGQQNQQNQCFQMRRFDFLEPHQSPPVK